MSNPSNAHRWVPFQCPLCFALFRLRKDQVGSVGHCPTCDSLVHVLAAAPAPVSSAPVAKSVESVEGVVNEEILDRIAVAEPMSPEELAEQEEALQNRKRHYAVGAVETLDWESDLQEETESRETPWLMIASVGTALVLALAAGAFYVKNMAPDKSFGASTVIGDPESKARLDALLDKSKEDHYQDENGVDSTLAIADFHQKFDLTKVEDVMKGFLNSTTVAERLKFVRDPKKVEPLMLRYYGGEDVEAEGFEQFNRAEVGYQKRLMTTTVLTLDFLSRPIAVMRLGEGDESTYKVDWESWVGYCDYSAEEMRAQNPTKEFVMRVMVSKGNYYNYGFANDKEWVCYNLSLREFEFSFLGYAKKGSDVEQELERVLKVQGNKPFTVKVAYPAKARSKDQVEIVEVVSLGWVTHLDEEKGDD